MYGDGKRQIEIRHLSARRLRSASWIAALLAALCVVLAVYFSRRFCVVASSGCLPAVPLTVLFFGVIAAACGWLANRLRREARRATGHEPGPAPDAGAAGDDTAV